MATSVGKDAAASAGAQRPGIVQFSPALRDQPDEQQLSAGGPCAKRRLCRGEAPCPLGRLQVGCPPGVEGGKPSAKASRQSKDRTMEPEATPRLHIAGNDRAVEKRLAHLGASKWGARPA